MRQSVLVCLFLVLAVCAHAQRILIQTGDKLTLLREDGARAVYYVQSVVPGRGQFVVYSMDTNAQYYMDAVFLQKFLIMVERKSRVVYLIEK